MPMPNYTFQLVATPIGGTAGLTLGDVIVYDPVTASYLLSTTANRGTKRSSAVCLGAAAVNGAVVAQNAGDIPPAVSGLGAGSAVPARVSSAGRIERASTPLPGDDICGWVEADGTVHLSLGGQASGPIIAGGPDGSGQVVANPTTWGPIGAPIKSKIETIGIAGAVGSPTTVGTIDIPDNTTCDLSMTLLARRSDGSSYRADFTGTYKRTSGGAPTLVGAAPSESNKRNDAGAAYTGDVTVSGNNVIVRLTPTAGHTLNATIVWQRQDRT